MFAGPPEPAKDSPSVWAWVRRSAEAASMADLEAFINCVKRDWRAFLLEVVSSAEEEVSLPLIADSNLEALSSPTSHLREGTEVRKWDISARGRKPQRPSKGVTAMVISGLWLSSG